MPRVIATIQVRMGSERLPGKTLREVAGQPMLGLLLDRVIAAETLDGVVVATPATAQNDPIEAYCKSRKIPCFRGPEDDVLARMLGSLEQEKADVGVEVYGDSPLNDPRIIDHVVRWYLDHPDHDLVGNDMKASYPSGLYIEAFSMKALRDSDKRCTDPAVREHGTLFLRQNTDRYVIKNLEAEGKLLRPDIHLDVDTEDDLKMIAAIAEHFAPRTDFSGEEIVAFLDAHPDIRDSNKHVHRRWKQYQRA